MKPVFIIVLSFFTTIGLAQNIVEWSKAYTIQFSDFQSNSTKIGNVNLYSLHSGVSMDFAYNMSGAEFMFKKNFNSAARCIFNKRAASLIAPDSATANSLVNFAQFEFDLTELYTRKFRKKLFEEKGTFSNSDFFQPIFNQIQAELNERNSNAGNVTDIGKNKKELEKLHKEVLFQIDELADYCYSCKPPKKKKKKN